MKPSKKNKARAKWAQHALDTFITAKQEAPTKDFQTEAQDLITDLLHFARVKGYDTSDILRLAMDHFDYEVKHEADNE